MEAGPLSDQSPLRAGTLVSLPIPLAKPQDHSPTGSCLAIAVPIRGRREKRLILMDLRRNPAAMPGPGAAQKWRCPEPAPRHDGARGGESLRAGIR
jgi:hypothetical protein